MIRFRMEHRILRTNLSDGVSGFPDISFHGETPWRLGRMANPMPESLRPGRSSSSNVSVTSSQHMDAGNCGSSTCNSSQ